MATSQRTSAMIISLRSPIADDVPILASIWTAAHADDEFTISVWSDVPTDDGIRDEAKRREGLQKVKGIMERGTKVLVAVDDDDHEVVGWTSWDVFPCEWMPNSADWQPPTGFNVELAEQRSSWAADNKKRLKQRYAHLACESSKYEMRVFAF